MCHKSQSQSHMHPKGEDHQEDPEQADSALSPCANQPAMLAAQAHSTKSGMAVRIASGKPKQEVREVVQPVATPWERFFRMYLGTNTANGPMVGWHDVRAPHCRTPPQGHSCHVLPTSIFLAESHQARLRGMPGPPKCRAPRRETCTTVAAQARTVHDMLFPLLPARQPLPPRCGRRCCPRRPQGCP